MSAPRALPAAPSLDDPATAHLEAERGLLGAVSLQPRRYAEVAPQLEVADFALDAHGLIWAAMGGVAAQGHAPDLMAVRAELRTRGQLEAIGGNAYLGTLLDYQARGVQLDTYVRLIRDAAVRRQLRAVARGLETAATSDLVETGATLDTTQQALHALTARLSLAEARGLVPAKDALPAVTRRVEALVSGQGLTGVSTGFRRLDWYTGGFRPGQMIVIAGRTGMGKTSLALQMAFHIAALGLGSVALYSLEMSAEENLLRAVCQIADVDSAALLHGRIREVDIPRVVHAIGTLGDAAWAIGDEGTVRVADVRRQCEALKVTSGLALVVVDYLQLMTATAKVTNRTEAVSEISRGLKCLARDLEVPVVALSQLSRAPKGQERKRPELSDLRESGAIEQDADKVIFVHRDDTLSGETTEGSLLLSKNRQGPCAVIPATWVAQSTRWLEES